MAHGRRKHSIVLTPIVWSAREKVLFMAFSFFPLFYLTFWDINPMNPFDNNNTSFLFIPREFDQARESGKV